MPIIVLAQKIQVLPHKNVVFPQKIKHFHKKKYCFTTKIYCLKNCYYLFCALRLRTGGSSPLNVPEANVVLPLGNFSPACFSFRPLFLDATGTDSICSGWILHWLFSIWSTSLLLSRYFTSFYTNIEPIYAKKFI